MQNWNAGKTQEYKERKEYVIDHSVLKHNGPIEETAPKAEEHTAKNGEHEGRSPRRRESDALRNADLPQLPHRLLLSRQGRFQVWKLMAGDNVELALNYGVKQAPTLVITDGRALRSSRARVRSRNS